MRENTTNSDRLSIAAASLRLGKSYNQVQRLILVRELTGGQDERGRWWVDTASLDAFEKRTRSASNAAA